MSVEERYLILFISLLVGALLILVSLGCYIFYDMKNKMRLKGLSLERIHQEELNAIIVKTQSNTLQCIGEKLHDSLGQKLTLAMLQAGAIRKDVDDLTEKQHMLNKTLQESIQDLRRISRNLNPNFIEDLGLYKGVEKEVYRLSKVAQVEVCLHTFGEPIRMEHNKEMVLFRTFQEAVNNSLKHSRAKHLNIELEYQAEVFKMKIADDGVGFDVKKIMKGTGLRNIQSNAKYVNAELLIESAELSGTSLSLVLPV